MQDENSVVYPLLTSRLPVTRTLKEKPGSVEVTSVQEKVLVFLRQYSKEHGFSASRPDMKKNFGLSSQANAHRCLERIQRRGWLAIAPGIGRGLRLLREGAPLYEPEDFRTTTTQVSGRDDTAREPDWIDCDYFRELCGGMPDFCLRVRGDAMNRAGLTESAIVAIKLTGEDDTPIADGDVVAARIDGDVVLRRYHVVDETTAELRPESTNPEHQVLCVGAASNAVEIIIGVVTGRMLAGAG